ncbi:MAG: dihydroorotase [Clostridia bacterium]|nr:dihydroorotase [Clostridia bacterium]
MGYTFKNATIIDADGIRSGDVHVENGIITDTEQENIIDCAGLVVMPALVDLHTHLRDPGYPQKETMESGMRAALKGGFATLCAMANTMPVCSTPKLVTKNHEKAAELSLCRLYQCGALGIDIKDITATDREALSTVTPMLSNDGNTIFSDAFMEQALIDSKKYGFVISTHCQPEADIVRRDIELLRKHGGNLHVGHISLKETLDMIIKARNEGLSITCEVTPHHLFDFDNPYKVNPPMRTKEDVLALIEGVKSGMIDCLATDHAPHTVEDKAAGMAGISNIEYALSVWIHVFTENDIPLSTLSRMASYNSARRIGLSDRLIKSGCIADITVVDTNKVYTIETQDMISRSHNTPFAGRKVRGKVKLTMVEGEIRYVDGQIGSKS